MALHVGHHIYQKENQFCEGQLRLNQAQIIRSGWIYFTSTLPKYFAYLLSNILRRIFDICHYTNTPVSIYDLKNLVTIVDCVLKLFQFQAHTSSLRNSGWIYVPYSHVLL